MQLATLVSAMWNVSSKHSMSHYRKWLDNALPINAPMVFFYEDESILALATAARRRLPTLFIRRAVSDLDSFGTNSSWTLPPHVPTHVLGVIWLNKILLLSEVAALNPYNTSWFAWTDAGNAAHRETRVSSLRWPRSDLLANLSADKVIYTDSLEAAYGHTFAGTAFMCSSAIVNHVARLFRDEVSRCGAVIGDYHCMSDQIGAPFPDACSPSAVA